MPKEWTFGGKHRVHHAPIKSLTFGESINEQGQKYFKLFSIGEDILMCEFNIINIDLQKGVPHL